MEYPIVSVVSAAELRSSLRISKALADKLVSTTPGSRLTLRDAFRTVLGRDAELDELRDLSGEILARRARITSLKSAKAREQRERTRAVREETSHSMAERAKRRAEKV